jgi:uncharacterized membrane protein
MWIYAKRLERDLKRWHEQGWLTGEGYRAILAEQARSKPPSVTAALAAIGAVLFGFAAISFVAANWSEMGAVYRTAVLIAALWIAYGAAAYLFKKSLPDFGQAAALTGTILFGATVMLVSQMYNINRYEPDLILLWLAGTLIAGAAFRSSLVLSFAMGLAALWAGAEAGFLPQTVQWHFLPVWAGVAALIAWNRSGVGLHLSAAVLSAWIIHLGAFLPGPWEAHSEIAAIGAAGVLIAAGVLAAAPPGLLRQAAFRAIPYAMIVTFGGLFFILANDQVPIVLSVFGTAVCAVLAPMLISPAANPLHKAVPLLFTYALNIALTGLLIMQFGPKWNLTLDSFIVAALAALAVLTSALALGIKAHSWLIMWLAYLGLIVEILGLYFKTIGTLINTSLFFLVAGVLVTGLAALLIRFGRQAPQDEAVS